MFSTKHGVPLAAVCVSIALSCAGMYASAQSLGVGDSAVLFQTWDEAESMVDMADMIDGRPLVLVSGSCT